MIKVEIHPLDIDKNPHAKPGDPWPIMMLSDKNKTVEKRLYWWIDFEGYDVKSCGRCIRLSAKILRQVRKKNGYK